MIRTFLLLMGAIFSSAMVAQTLVMFPSQDGGTVYADWYPGGDSGVVLAHGGQFHKESWLDQAKRIQKAGFSVVAIDFRGLGKTTGPGSADPMSAPLLFDVLAAVRYLNARGLQRISVVGASLGGGAAGDASILSKPGVIDRIVFLGSAPNQPASGLKSRSLFIVARDDADGRQPRLPEIRAQYDAAPQPKELIVVDGSAHAQFLFKTDQGERVMKEILRFLLAP